VLDESHNGTEAAASVERFVERDPVDVVTEHQTSGFERCSRYLMISSHPEDAALSQRYPQEAGSVSISAERHLVCVAENRTPSAGHTTGSPCGASVRSRTGSHRSGEVAERPRLWSPARRRERLLEVQ
jgi:hypothetical protein